jgi:hypothetical protein
LEGDLLLEINAHFSGHTNTQGGAVLNSASQA